MIKAVSFFCQINEVNVIAISRRHLLWISGGNISAVSISHVFDRKPDASHELALDSLEFFSKPLHEFLDEESYIYNFSLSVCSMSWTNSDDVVVGTVQASVCLDYELERVFPVAYRFAIKTAEDGTPNLELLSQSPGLATQLDDFETFRIEGETTQSGRALYIQGLPRKPFLAFYGHAGEGLSLVPIRLAGETRSGQISLEYYSGAVVYSNDKGVMIDYFH